jgi:hypothetical protein
MSDRLAIEACDVPETQRPGFIPAQVGPGHAFRFLCLVEVWMSLLSRDHSGGDSRFVALSNGGFFVAPAGKAPMHVAAQNGFESVMSADGAGIVATLYALCHLSEEAEDDNVTMKYHALRDFAMREHAEAASIAQAID